MKRNIGVVGWLCLFVQIIEGFINKLRVREIPTPRWST